MIAYRFLHPAEQEMNEASSFYESANDGLGIDFLADVQLLSTTSVNIPTSGR